MPKYKIEIVKDKYGNRIYIQPQDKVIQTIITTSSLDSVRKNARVLIDRDYTVFARISQITATNVKLLGIVEFNKMKRRGKEYEWTTSFDMKKHRNPYGVEIYNLNKDGSIELRPTVKEAKRLEAKRRKAERK